MPDWRSYVRERLRLPALKPEREAEIVEDLAQQLDEAYREALRRGATEAEAAATARRHITDWPALAYELQQTRRGKTPSLDRWQDRADVRGGKRGPGAIFAGLLRDVLYGLRMLRKNPGFTAVAVVTLALGIGANTAMFSVVRSVLLKPLPLPDSQRLVYLWEKTKDLSVMMVAYPDYLDWRAQNSVFEDIAVYNRYRNVNLTGGEQPERLSAAWVSANYFRVLQVQPALGRGFTEQEDQRGGAPAVILSHGLWQRRFGGDPGIVGQAIRLDGQSSTVIGIMPAGFQFPSGIELWLPLGRFVDESMLNRANHPGLVGVARLRPGVSGDTARAAMETLAQHLEKQYPDTNQDVGVTVTPMLEVTVGGIRQTLVILLGSVSFVLLIACANVASLLLARGVGRQREIAMRIALGAGPGRIVQQLLTESLLLAAAGGLLGLLLAHWGVEVVRTLGPSVVPRSSDISIDPWVLGFTLGVSVFTGLMFGIAPALQFRDVALVDTLREGSGQSGSGRRRQRLQKLLLVGEIALSLMLLVGAGLMLKSFSKVLEVNPGFHPEGLLTLRISLPPAKYPSGETITRFSDQLLEQVQRIPGAKSAALVSWLPFGAGGWQTSTTVEGAPSLAAGENPPLVNGAVISPDYFDTLGIPLLKGRRFNPQDDAHAPGVAIVNESFARRFWPGQDALGKRVRFGSPTAPWAEVVGIARDVKRSSLEDPTNAAEFNLPYAQAPGELRSMNVVVRAVGIPSSLINSVRKAVLAVDPDQPVFGAREMLALLASSVAPRRFSTLLLGILAAVALSLAVAGLYGLVSYSVAQRTHEIGIRLALGAQPRDVLRMVVRQGMTLILLGLVIGVAGAFGLTRLLSNMLFEVKPTDPITFFGVAALLAAVALLACYVPARRATKVDPIVALRYE